MMLLKRQNISFNVREFVKIREQTSILLSDFVYGEDLSRKKVRAVLP